MCIYVLNQKPVMRLEYFLKQGLAFFKTVPTIDKYRANSIAANKCYTRVQVNLQRIYKVCGARKGAFSFRTIGSVYLWFSFIFPYFALTVQGNCNHMYITDIYINLIYRSYMKNYLHWIFILSQQRRKNRWTFLKWNCKILIEIICFQKADNKRGKTAHIRLLLCCFYYYKFK